MTLVPTCAHGPALLALALALATEPHAAMDACRSLRRACLLSTLGLSSLELEMWVRHSHC